MAEVEYPQVNFHHPTMDSKARLALLLDTFLHLNSRGATATLHSHGGKVKTSSPSRPPPTSQFVWPNAITFVGVCQCPLQGVFNYLPLRFDLGI